MRSNRVRRLLNFNSWSTLDKSSVQKSDIFLSQFALLAIIGAGISAVHDAFFESLETVLIDVLIAIVFIITFRINERGKHLRAKLIFVFISPTTMFFYASVLPKESGVYFIFFPIIMIIFLLFDRKDRLFKLTAIIYTLTLFFILEYTDYQPFGYPPILGDMASDTSYTVNLMISLFVIIFSLFSIESLNAQIEKKRLAAVNTINERNEELKEINNELDQFVYSASHDLKAPLLSVLGLINIAKYDVKDEISLNYFQQIEKRILRLNAFIKEVLSISKNARTEILKEAVDVRKFIEDIIEQNNYIEGINEVKLNIDIQFSQEVLIDKYRLEIILNNIISNALKYQKKDRDDQQINILGELKSNNLKLQISDNGVGISEADRLKVFDMFYRANEKSEGSGLGLYIVQSALKKLNGKISLDSSLNVGTNVSLSIPIMN